MKTVLIIGASSQLGSELCQLFLARSFRVVGTGRNLSKIKSNITKEWLDITDRPAVFRLLETYRPDIVINCAAIVSVADSWSNPQDYLTYNSVSLIHQLDAIKQYSPGCIYFNAGSIEEFNVDNFYGLSKLMASKILQLYRSKYPMILSNGFCSNLVSFQSKDDFIIPKLVKSLLRIRRHIDNKEPYSPILVGNLNATRNFIHVSDVALCIYKIVETGKSMDIPIVGDEYISIYSLVEKIKAKLLIPNYEQVTQVTTELWRPDNQAKITNRDTKSLIDWTPSYSLDKIIDEMINHYSSK